MEERLQKILSRYGIASRRKAEELISERRVRVNGNTASLGDTAVDGEDVIEVDGVRLKKEPERLYLMLNKPRGYVTTLSDEKGRKNVSELVQDCGGRVYPVGRLDLYSEGLLLMTNDGEFANRIMHPKKEIEKKYLGQRLSGGLRGNAPPAHRDRWPYDAAGEAAPAEPEGRDGAF